MELPLALFAKAHARTIVLCALKLQMACGLKSKHGILKHIYNTVKLNAFGTGKHLVPCASDHV